MSAMTIVVTLELKEFQLQIGGRPEKRAIQAFPSSRANEPFNEGMGVSSRLHRQRGVRHKCFVLPIPSIHCVTGYFS
jgi:hypothetical protein